MRRAAVFVLIVAMGCSRETAEPVDVPAATPLQAEATPPRTPDTGEAVKEGYSTARVRAIDIEGRPLPNLIPIVTSHANAFERPLQQGPPTDTGGFSTVLVPDGAQVYVRVWDPGFRLFANNYFTIHPDAGALEDVMEVVMLPGASIEVSLVTADGRPVSHANVDLVLYHPAEGAWWPTQERTDSEGHARFAHIPAGNFRAEFRAPPDGVVDAGIIALSPGATVELGTVQVRRGVTP